MTTNKKPLYMSSFIDASNRFRRAIVTITIFTYVNALYAGPSGENIQAGTASITRSGLTTTINQNSNKLAIDWDNFDIAKNELVQFVQPSKNALALNRIFDNKASEILGQLNANGKIMLVNPRGILFGKDATIDVNSLIATSLMIDTDDFMAGNYQFEQFEALRGKIINNGNITAASGGAIALIGHIIENDGTLTASNGSVQLIGASDVVLSFDNHDQLGVIVNQEILDNQFNEDDAIKNTGTLSAEDGYILVAGHVAQDLFDNAVNHEGLMEATSMTTEGGVIKITGEGVNITGDINVDGSTGGTIAVEGNGSLTIEEDALITAVGTENQGGSIELYADNIGIYDNVVIDASGSTGGGKVNIGGQFQGKGDRNARNLAFVEDANVKANAIDSGSGGEIILWADNHTEFSGSLSATSYSGEGGFAEVSGKETLNFRGTADLTIAQGGYGTLLLDPNTITILDGAGPSDEDSDLLDDNDFDFSEGASDSEISEEVLENLDANIELQARDAIIISDLADNELSLNSANTAARNITFTVNNNGGGNVSITQADANERITFRNTGTLTFQATQNASLQDDVNITLGDIELSDGGSLVITGESDAGADSAPVDNNVTISVGNIDVIGGGSSGSVTITAQSEAIGGTAQGHAVNISVDSIDVGGSGDINITALTTSANEETGNATVDLGNLTSGSGNITVSATADGNGAVGPTLDATTTINMDGAQTTTGTITVTANQPDANVGETINLNGSYITEGQLIDIDGRQINLDGDTVFDTTNDGANAGANVRFSIISATTPLDAGGNNLTFKLGSGDIIRNPGDAVIPFNSDNFINLGALGFDIIGDIYIGDISGGTHYSQTDLNNFSSLSDEVSFITEDNIFVSDASFEFVDITLTADSDLDGTGTFEVTTGKTMTITDDSSSVLAQTINIDGADVDIQGNITVNEGALDIDATNTTVAIAGNISTQGETLDINSTTNITFGASSTIDTNNGNIVINSGAAITSTDGAQITSDTGSIDIDAVNDITLSGITSTSTANTAINVNSSAGSILDGGDTFSDYTATAVGSRLTLTASTSVGSGANALEVRATEASVSAGDVINVLSDQALSIISAVTTGASNAIDIVVGGDASLSVNGAITSNGGVITLAADDDVIINSSNTVTTANGNLVITADNDSDNNGTGGAITLDGNLSVGSGTITLSADEDIAVTGITTTNATNNAVSITSTSGAIVDSEDTAAIDISATSGRVTLNAATTIGEGGDALDIRANEVSLTAGDLINVLSDQALSVITAVTTGASDAIDIVVGGDASLSVNGAITSNGGVITLAADDDVIINSSNTVTTANGNLVITADNDNDNNGTGGAITLDGNLSVGSGTVTLSADEDIAITGITTTNATNNAVSITSTSGAIVDSEDTAAIDISAASGRITLNAATAIGEGGDALDIRANEASLTAGDLINVLTDQALSIISAVTTGASDILTIAVGGDASMSIDGNITANGGIVTLTADDDIIFGGAHTVNSNGGNIVITADNDSDASGTGGALTMADDSAITSGAGTVTLSADQMVTITGITTTNATGSAVSITSTSEGIRDASTPATDNDITATASGATVTLNAASGVGTLANPIEINVDDIAVNNGTSGDIALNSTNDFSVGSLDNSSSVDGGIRLDTQANLTITGTLQTNNQAIVLNAADNISIDGTASLQSSGGAITITADSADTGVATDGTGSLTITDGADVTSSNGNITLASAEDATITGLSAGSGNVQVASSGGSILDSGDSASDIANSGTLTLSASGTNGSIGTGGNALELSATQLTATANNGAINVINNQSLQTNAIDSNGGDINIDVTSNTGDLTVASTIQSDGGDINLTANQNIAVNDEVTSGNGNIIIIAGDDTGIDNLGTLVVADTINSGTGTIALTGDQDVTITDILANNTVTILSNNGSILDNSTPATDTDITGTIVTLTANGTNGSIGTGGNALELSATQLTATANNGAINVTNDQSLQTNAINSNGGDISIDVTGDTSNLTVASTLQSGGGAITLTADQNIAVNNALTSSNGNIIMIAGDDAGSDNNGTLTVADIGGTTINSGSGTIALTGDQDVSITDLLATNTITLLSNNGNILDNSTTPGDIDISGTVVTLTASGTNGSIGTGGNVLELSATQLTATANNGVINVTNNQSLQTNAIDSNGAAITITTTGATSSLSISSTLASDGGLVTLTSGDNLLIGAAGAISSASGNIVLDASSSDALLTMTDGAVIDSGNGNIDIDADGDTTITGINAGTGTVVDITSVNGSILDAGDSAIDIIATSATVTLVSETGIGDDGSTINALEVDAASLSASNDLNDSSGEGNDIAIAFQGNVNFTGGLTNGVTGGGFSLGSTGSFTVDTDITTVDGDIALNAGTTLTINDGRSIDAGNALVDLLATLDINVTGVNSDSSSNTAITITSTGGQILDGGNSLDDISASNGRVVIDAQTNIGTGGDGLEMSVASVNLSNDAAGVMNISNDQNLVVVSADNQNGNIDITTNSGSDLNVTGDVNSNSGTINLLADGDITINNNADITSAGGTITLVADNDSSTAGNILLQSGSSINAGGGNTQLTSADTITLASLLNINTLTANANITTFNSSSSIANLSTTSSTINANADLAITAGGLTTTNLNLANNVDLTTAGNTQASTTSIGSAGINRFTSSADGNIQLGNVTGTGANLQISSSGNTQLAAVAIGSGDLDIVLDSNNNESVSSTISSVSAGTISIVGSAAQNDSVTISGDITGSDITISDVDNLSLQRAIANGSLQLSATSISLANDLTSNGLLSVDGATTLSSSITMDSNGNATNGGKVDIIGSLDGSGFDLTIDAGTHVACTNEATVSNVGNLSITDSIKTVLGLIDVNDSLNVNATQEIYLNENVTTGGDITFNADSDNNGNGVVYQLTGRTLDNGGNLSVLPGELLTSSTAANCDLPTQEPTLPQPPEIPPTVTPEIVRITEFAEQESAESKLAVNDTFLATPPKVTYLETCSNDDEGGTSNNNCDMDESVRSFLGTFLIDFQLPGN